MSDKQITFSGIKDYVLTPGAGIFEDICFLGSTVVDVVKKTGIDEEEFNNFLRLSSDNWSDIAFFSYAPVIAGKLHLFCSLFSFDRLIDDYVQFREKSKNPECLVISYDDMVNPNLQTGIFRLLHEKVDEIIKEEDEKYKSLVVLEHEVDEIEFVVESWSFLRGGYLKKLEELDQALVNEARVYENMFKKNVICKEHKKDIEAMVNDEEFRLSTRPFAPIYVKSRIAKVRDRLEKINQALSEMSCQWK